MWMNVLAECMCTMYAPGVCVCQKMLLKLWDWNYISLLAAIGMLGNKPGSSVGEKSYPNH